MNLSLGEIELNGVIFDKKTNIDELMGNPKFSAYVNNSSPIGILTSKQVSVDGYTFDIKIFFINKRINKIQLTPVNLEMRDPGYPDEKYQEEKKKVADSFLQEKLGVPLKENEAVHYYEFDWGSISSVAFLSGRNEYTGGFIEMLYRK